VSQKTGTPLKVIVSRIQAHKIKQIFYQRTFKPILRKSWNFWEKPLYSCRDMPF